MEGTASSRKPYSASQHKCSLYVLLHTFHWHEYINGDASDSREFLVAQYLQHSIYNLSHAHVSDSAWAPACTALEHEIETWPAVQHVVLCCSVVTRLWCSGRHLTHVMLHLLKQGLLCSGAVQRPWCPEARLAEHTEAETLKEEAERKRTATRSAIFGAPAPQRPARTDFPPLQVACCHVNQQSMPSGLV